MSQIREKDRLKNLVGGSVFRESLWVAESRQKHSWGMHVDGNVVCVCFKSNMSKRREVGLFVVSLIHTAHVTTESMLRSRTENLLRCETMWFLECGLFATERQSLEFPHDCHCSQRWWTKYSGESYQCQ